MVAQALRISSASVDDVILTENHPVYGKLAHRERQIFQNKPTFLAWKIKAMLNSPHRRYS